MRKYLTLLLLLGLFYLPQGLRAGGGPDAYGYTWLDSNDPGGPTYNWIDTTAAWTQVSGLADDNSVGMYTFGWKFHFYWGDYNGFKLGSNGWLSFNNVSNIAHCFPTIPTAGGAGDLFLAPLMSDLTFSSAFPAFPNPGKVYYWTNGVDSFVVSYLNVPFWQAGTPDWTGSNSFQILLDGTDSSITYNYKAMNPTFNNTAGCTSDIVIGIENSTGAIGLQCWNDVIPANNYSIRFDYPAQVLISVKDLTPQWNQNTVNGGEFYPTGLIPTLQSLIKNAGNDSVTTATTVTGTIRNLAMQNQYTSSVQIPNFQINEDTLVTFTPQAVLNTAGQYYFETAATNATDINPGNNVNTTELNMVNLTGPTAQLTYHTGGNNTGSISWNGGNGDDGVGVYQIPPVYPVTINSLEFYIASNSGVNYVAAIYDDSGPGGTPGTLLAIDTVVNPTTGAWSTVNLTTPPTITSGGYYVAWFQGGAIAIGTENTGPISFRSYEILSGQWAQYRSNTLEDFLIRVNIGGYPCAITADFSSQANANVVDFTNGSTGATSYFWDFGDGNNSTATSPQHTYTQPGTYNVCLIATSVCGADTICNPVTVTCPAPSADFSSTATGITANFSDQSTGNVIAWFWDFGDGNTSTQQNPTHSFAQPGSYWVCLIATNACGNDTLCDSVTVCTVPFANFNHSETGLTVTMSNFTSGATSFAWDFGDGNTSTQQNPAHTYAQSGTYWACLIASNACYSDTICDSVTVCAPPAGAFSFSQNQQTITFTDQTAGAPTSWLWDFGDGNTSTQQNPSHTYAVQDTFTVCLVVTDACGSDTTCQDVSTVIIGMEDAFLTDLKLWPNPTDARMNVHGSDLEAGTLQWELFDLAGRLVMAGSLEHPGGALDLQLDLGSLPAGMYQLGFRNAEQRLVRRIVVE